MRMIWEEVFVIYALHEPYDDKYIKYEGKNEHDCQIHCNSLFVQPGKGVH